MTWVSPHNARFRLRMRCETSLRDRRFVESYSHPRRLNHNTGNTAATTIATTAMG